MEACNTNENVTSQNTIENKMSLVLEEFTNLMSKFDASLMNIEKIDGVEGGFIIYNCFSEEECLFLIKSLEFNEDVVYKNTENKIYRQNLRLQINNSLFTNKILERVKRYLPDKLEYKEDSRELGAFSKGCWDLLYLNDRVRFCKYLNEGLFSPHYDGCFIKSQDERSFLTIMFYLNEDYEGGETVFLDQFNNNSVVSSIKPKRGMMVFFPQDVYHEGRPVRGEKYICRTDIVYKRNFEQEGTSLTQEQIDIKKQAIKYLELAQELERCRQGMKAVEYYRKAFKLDPDLEKVIR